MDAPEGADLAPSVSGPVNGQPTVIEAFGPNGELLTMKLGEDGVYRTVHSNVPSPPVSAEVDHPLLTALRSRTAPTTRTVRRLPAYNNPLLYYMKTDGEIVCLQGDPGNRAFYEELGYVVLRPEEVNTYTKDQYRMVPDGRGGMKREVIRPAVRRLVIKEQRRRAELITMIRNIASRNPTVEVTGSLSLTPTNELEGLLVKLRSNQSINFTLLEARARHRPEDDPEDESAEGVELSSGADLERKLTAYARSQDQLVENRRMNPVQPDH